MLEHKFYNEDLRIINNTNLPLEKLEGKSILITGGSGLICSVLVDALIYRNETHSADIDIWVLSRNEVIMQERFKNIFGKKYFHYLKQDICEKIKIDAPIAYIIHGAGKGDPYSFSTDPVGIMQANYMGMYQVLELAKKMKAEKVLYISSGEIYGQISEKEVTNNPKDIGIRETDYGYLDILSPRSCYASSKRAAETMCISYSGQYDMNVSVARPCHTYGPAMLESDNRVIGEFIRKAVRKSDIVLKSEGIQKRSYCYVADVAAALLTILLKGENCAAYNIADKNSIVTIRELAELVALKSGTVVKQEAPNETELKGYSKIIHAVLNASKLEGLGWKPKVGIQEGIERTIQILKL